MIIPLIYILMSYFQPFLLDFMPMISCYVMCHVTMVTCIFIIQEIKKTENKRKKEIKSKKI